MFRIRLFMVRESLSTYQDAELLRLYRETHRSDYLVELYERYTALVYGVALKYLKNISDAQDAVMQIWEDLFQKVLHHDIHIFKSWLYTCVRNHCLMELRLRSGNVTLELDDKFMEFCDDFNPYREDDEYKQKEWRKALENCMEKLPETQRICVRYFFIEEQSYKEIGENSGFSLKSVKSYIQNGKRNLRLCLERKGVKL